MTAEKVSSQPIAIKNQRNRYEQEDYSQPYISDVGHYLGKGFMAGLFQLPDNHRGKDHDSHEKGCRDTCLRTESKSRFCLQENVQMDPAV